MIQLKLCAQFALALIMLSTIWSTSMGDPRTTLGRLSCKTAKSLSGDEQADNFVAAMVNLSSLVDRSGYGVAISGQGPNAVFALAQCFRDLGGIDCRLCFSEIRSLMPRCYPRIGGRVFFDGCFGRFDNSSFFGQAVDSEDTKICSSARNTSEPVKFREAAAKAIQNVTSQAQSGQGFAIASASVSKSTVYTLAQCWQSLDKQDCSSCLNVAASSLLSCLPMDEGHALNAGCYMRYATQIIWNVNQTSSSSSGTSRKIRIMLGPLIGGMVLIAAAVVWMIKKFRRQLAKSSTFGRYSSGLPSSFCKTKLNFPYKEMKKATNNFDSSNKIGQGSHGTVYMGVLSDGREIAVKRLFLNTRQWIDQFINEVELVSQVRHRNLVKLLGCSADGPESLLVYDYYANGSLDQFIFDERQAKRLVWSHRLDIIAGIADGLHYLHDKSDVRIIHRDIKASNVLLDSNFRPRITDFGLARSFGPDLTHLSTAVAGTLGYMAPEYAVHGHLTEKADVYSFGVLVLEIATGVRCSVSSESHTGQFFLAKVWKHYKAGKVEELIDRNIFYDNIKESILHVVQVALLCTQVTPSLRPTMAQVVEFLRNDGEHGSMVPTDPPVFDILGMDGVKLGDGTNLFPLTAEAGVSGSTEWQSGRA